MLMLEGVALDKVAAPPLSDKVKSPTSKLPLPPVALKTASEMVTVIVELSEATVVPVMVGTVPSNVQLNWVAAVLLLAPESVKTPPATSIVVAPSLDGVKVAV